MKHRVVRRRGFTILELMVVIAIITVLATLLLSAVFKVYSVADNLEARRELAMIENAIKAFCSDPRFGQVDFIPSKLDPSGTDPLSAAYLRRVFPKTGGHLRLPQTALEGHEVMVLFLGGPNNQGWSMDSLSPDSPAGERVYFYNFKGTTVDGTNRLQPTNKGGTTGIQTYCYLDRWGTPIAYFSPHLAISDPSNPNAGAQWIPPTYYPNDCQSCKGVDGNPAKPYANENLTSFQLISAGKDKSFGQGNGMNGSPWSTTNIYPRGNAGFDDFANFSGRTLGSSQ